MNTINCPKCGIANEADLNFCLNCGAALRAPSPPPATQPQSSVAQQQARQRPPMQPPLGESANNFNVNAKPARGGANRNLAIFGGLGCIGLALGAVALLGLLYYIGANQNNRNARNVVVVNQNRNANRRQTNAATNAANASSTSASDATLSNSDDYSNANANDNSATDNTNTITDVQTEKILPEQLGGFKRQGAIVKDAGIEMDGALTASKATYAFNKKSVETFVVEFPDADAAKNGYTGFLANSRADAKILKREKLTGKNNSNGEYVVYTFRENGKTQYEALFHTGKYAFQFIAPDQLTLTLFLVAYSTNAQNVGQ